MNVRIVLKTGWIVLGVIFVLLCGAERGSVRPAAIPAAGSSLSFSVADGASDEMHCERTCNSDLNLLTRLAPGRIPVQTVLPGMCRCRQGLARAFVRPAAAAAGSAGTMCAVSRIKFIQTLSAGVPSVDFYVYRLRRLII